MVAALPVRHSLAHQMRVHLYWVPVHLATVFQLLVQSMMRLRS
jgi:hypothetical protein